ncbi:U4/U6 small nuclear ribonucleoprotein Prp4 [Papilio machaon]|uniref:U4/U6 small nuclear ribonucleoprotein Prp4 n=1 Tax=Papilio machaon TaxID=76193 RepID=A0A0N1IA31_PAPMA|nr:U4/U6 small nuclear ribonucleoprotein Prp4 [Papilio machaon]
MSELDAVLCSLRDIWDLYLVLHGILLDIASPLPPLTIRHIHTYIQKYIHYAKIWDIRKRAPIYTIPAHTHLVSDVRYQRSHGHYLATSSYDGSGKLWSDPAWHPLRTLSGHDNKVMSVDISLDNKYIATCSYDRTFKLWAPDLA